MENRVDLAFNRQLNKEFYSAYLYFGMSSYFSSINLDGFAKYMKDQAKEELEHANMFYDYMLLRHFNIKLERIEEPDSDFSSALSVIERALSHEKYITSEIINLSNLSKDTGDTMSEIFLQKLIMEQAEEEDKFLKMYERIKYNEECGCTVEHIDCELKK